MEHPRPKKLLDQVREAIRGSTPPIKLGGAIALVVQDKSDRSLPNDHPWTN